MTREKLIEIITTAGSDPTAIAEAVIGAGNLYWPADMEEGGPTDPAEWAREQWEQYGETVNRAVVFEGYRALSVPSIWTAAYLPDPDGVWVVENFDTRGEAEAFLARRQAETPLKGEDPT
jgi:hypothetical protein